MIMFGGSVKIRTPRSLYKRLKVQAERRGYATVDEMILHVLEREVDQDVPAEQDDEIERRLRGLGYIE